jgi:predicted RND superfamily exporter protein
MYRIWSLIARGSHRHSYLWLGITALLCVPAYFAFRHIGLDTNLKRLLPEHAPSVRWSNELEDAVGDGGYFSILLQSEDADALVEGVEALAAKVGALPSVRSVDFRHPKEFIDRYRYTLVPHSVLREFQEEIEEWEIEVNPFLLDLDEPAEEEITEEDAEESDRLDRLLEYYANIDRYHTNPDGDVMGMIVRTNEGISNLASLRGLYQELNKITEEVADQRGLWWGIHGNLRSRVDEFDLIVSDLARAGMISVVAILITLALSFRSILILPVVLYPLMTGLLWSFALVPFTVGDLNTITAFLLLVLFGMGVDYAVHLISRFQHELTERGPEEALQATLSSTGRSVLTSGATTAAGLAILAISDFRGFSDFGLIGGSSMAIIVLSMLLVLPPTLIAGHRWKLIKARKSVAHQWKILLPSRTVTVLIAVLVVVAMIIAVRSIAFDYDFTNLRAEIPGRELIQERHEAVYPATSAPAAIYVARDLEALDGLLEQLEVARHLSRVDQHIGTINSVRNFAPDLPHFEQRLEVLDEIRESLEGRWVRRIEDQTKLDIIDDFLQFEPPTSPAQLEEVPASILDGLTARDGSGEFIVGVDTNGRSRDGRMAMAFTRDLYDLKLPAGVRGPTGDKPVLSEILWLVTSQSGPMVGLTLLGILLLVWSDWRSLRRAVWVLTPLVAGLLLTLGAMVVINWKFNFFNMVVLPTLLGVGVDHGVHYYRRWRELGFNTRKVHDELVGPVTVCSLTTTMGYLGMVMAHHPGLKSIGSLAVLGLTATWLTALVFLPGILRWRERYKRSVEPEGE